MLGIRFLLVPACLAQRPLLVLDFLPTVPAGLHVHLRHSLLEIRDKVFCNGPHEHDRHGLVATRLVCIGQPRPPALELHVSFIHVTGDEVAFVVLNELADDLVWRHILIAVVKVGVFEDSDFV